MTVEKRLPVFPTRMNQAIIEAKIKSAEKGHGLLKKKSDALQSKFKQTQSKIKSLRTLTNNSLKEAYTAMSKAEYFGGNIPFYLNECVKSPASVSVTTEIISGVTLPIFKLILPGKKEVISHGKGGAFLMAMREKFLISLDLLLKLSTIENSFKILDEVYSATNRRVNSLEFNLIPTLKNTKEYVLSELDEREREDFFRLKKIQTIKKQKKS